MTGPVITCLGKAPVHGDFLRLNHQQAPEIVELDQWLLQGMERLYGQRGRTFEAELRALQPCRFLFTSPATGRVLAGILVPSADKVGRTYPLVIAFQTEAAPPGPAYDRLPLAMAPSLTAALDFTRADRTGQNLQQFLEEVQALPFRRDDNGAEQELRTFLLATSLDALFAAWPGFQVPARREAFLQEMRHVARLSFPPRFVASIPTQGRPAEVGFWLMLLRQWLPYRVNPVLSLWPADPVSAQPLRLLYDELQPRYFEALFWPERDSEYRLDLGRSEGVRRPTAGADDEDLFAAMLRPRTLLQDAVLAAGHAH